MVAVIRGKLKCCCYSPPGLRRNYFLLINFTSVQELGEKKRGIKLNEQFLPQSRLWHRKIEENIKTPGQQLAPNEAARKQFSFPQNILICLILWKAIAHIFYQRPSEKHGDGGIAPRGSVYHPSHPCLYANILSALQAGD